jgi:hypothetical protein
MDFEQAVNDMRTILASDTPDPRKWNSCSPILNLFKHETRDNASIALKRIYLCSIMYSELKEISFVTYCSNDRETGMQECYQWLILIFTCLEYYKNHHTQDYMEHIEFIDEAKEKYTELMMYIEDYFGDRTRTDMTNMIFGLMFFNRHNRNVNSSGLL